MSRPPFTHTWIEDQKLMAGSIPTSGADCLLLARLGVRAVLSLTRRNPADCPDIAAGLSGISHRHVPIPDGGLPDEAGFEFAMGYLDYHYAHGTPVYVHCRGGIGRTGTIIIAYYVLGLGWSVTDARDKVRVRRNYEGNATAADQGSPQREFIDGLEQRRADRAAQFRAQVARFVEGLT